MEDWQIRELIDIADKGMKKLAKDAPELFGKLVDTLDDYHMNKVGTLETIKALEGECNYYLYDHRR